MFYKLVNAVIILPSFATSSVLQITIDFNNQKIHKYRNLFAIGDSLTDGGASVAAGTFLFQNELKFKLLGLEKFSLKSPYYQNRTYSNGPTAIELLCKALQLPFKPGWDATAGTFWWKKTGSQVGTNYAFGGSTIMPTTWPRSIFTDQFTLEKQTNAIINHHDLSSQDLVFINIGTNDFTYQSDYNLNKNKILIYNMIDKLSATVTNLFQKGATDFVISNLPNYGLTPLLINKPKGFEITKTIEFYNLQLAKKINDLNVKYKLINIKMFNLFEKFALLRQEFLSRGPQYRFDNATFNDYSILSLVKNRGSYQPVYVNQANWNTINNYFFLDQSHPTTWVHHKMATYLKHFINLQFNQHFNYF